jgi:HEAT repeat protein
MNRYRKTVIIILAAALVLGPSLRALFFTGHGLCRALPGAGMTLSAAEKVPVRDIKGLIHDVLNENDDTKKNELIKKLRAFPAEEVGSCWLELLDGAVRVGTTVRIIDGMSEFMDKRFVQPLARYLISPHYAIRKSAARALKKTGDDRLFPVILGMVNSSNPVHRIYFIEAMNYLYDQRFYPSLTGLLRDENKSIRIYVLNCLKENRITESLGNIRNAAMSDRNDEVRIAAIDAIGVMRDGNGLSVLHVTLNDKNRDIRCESVKSISRINSAASVNPLSLRLFLEDDNEIKDIAIEALSGLRRTGDTRGLEKILQTDRNQGLRVKSAYVLGFSGSQQAFAALREGLKDPDFRVRAEVCNSLGSFRNRQALEILFEVLDKEEQVYVKSAALYSIKRINDKSSLLGLFDRYNRENDPIFREMLREAIREYIKRYI